MVTRSFALVVFMAILTATTQASAPVPPLYSTVQTEKVVPNLAAVHETTFWLVSRTVTVDKNKQKVNSDKGCGATAVADNVIATATHCLVNSGEFKDVIALDLNPVAILVRVDDGSDNSLVKVNAHLPHHTRISSHEYTWGDEVFIFGNPGTLLDMYRHGEIMGYANPATKGEGMWVIVDMNTGKGDSGSGIMNNYGEVIGTVSEIALADKREIKMPFVTAKVTSFHPFNFTKKQLKAVGLDN